MALPAHLVLSERQKFVIDHHLAAFPDMSVKTRSVVSDNYATVYDPKKARLWAHYLDARKSGRQELIFESAGSVSTCLTTHGLKFWDRRRKATVRELARVQGFRDDELAHLPTSYASHLFGNAVCVPCAAHALQAVAAGVHAPTTMLDLCCGIGGFHVAAKRVWPSIAVVACADIKPCAIATYHANFPDVPNMGDVTDASIAWPQHVDLVTAGFPCQPFSRSQKRDRDSHPAHDVYKSILRVVGVTHARLVVLENVLSMVRTGSEVIAQITSNLEQMGYDVRIASLNAHDFAVPQQRHRLYFVARRRDASPPPETPDLVIPAPPACRRSCLGDIMQPDEEVKGENVRHAS